MTLRGAVRTAVLAVGLVGVFSRPAAARYEGSVDLVAGAKWLGSDWAPADVQSSIGVMLAFAPERSRVWFAIDVLASRGSADALDPVAGPTHTTGSTVEYCLGIRKVWTRALFRPHLGAGGELVDASLEQTTASTAAARRGDSIGIWTEAGFSFRVVRHLDIGIDARYSSARLDLGQGFDIREVAAGGVRAGILIGYGW